MAISSLMNMSGYFVLAKSSSKSFSCAFVKVVRSRRCFLGGPLMGKHKALLRWSKPVLKVTKIQKKPCSYKSFN